MGFLTGKRALVVGVASERSIASGIAKAMHREGAELAYTYQTEKLLSRVEKLAKETNSTIMLPCDVSSDEQIDHVFAELKQRWGSLDIIIHSVAYAPREELAGNYIDSATPTKWVPYLKAGVEKCRRPLRPPASRTPSWRSSPRRLTRTPISPPKTRAIQ